MIFQHPVKGFEKKLMLTDFSGKEWRFGKFENSAADIDSEAIIFD